MPMRKVSISFALARFVFLSFLALACITIVIVVNHVSSSFNAQQEQLLEREMATISNYYQQFINNRLIILQEQGASPLIVQSLMQPENNIGQLQDVMRDFSFLGKHHQQSLLDFEGELIYSTNNNEEFHHTNASWLAPLLNYKQKQYFGFKLINNEYHWVLARPIVYNNGVEGVLTASIAIKDMDHAVVTDSVKDGLSISLKQDELILGQFGGQISGITRTKQWQQAGVLIEFTFDDAVINSAINSLVMQLSLLIVFAVLFSTLLAYYFGYRQLVQPIQHLSRATDTLEVGDQAQQLQCDVGIKELANLTLKFNKMATKVQSREKALKASYQQLAQSTEDLKLSESQLVQAEKMASIGVLAAGVAHEINNPIGFVKSNIEVLTGYGAALKNYHQGILDLLPDNKQQALQALQEKYDINYLTEDITPLLSSTSNGVERVAEIVESLKTFARQDSPEKTLADINEGLKATINMAHNEIKYHCQLTTDLSPLPLVYIFPGKLNQVFMNLIINAAHAISDRGTITIKTYIEGKNIVISFQDDGCGIPKENIDQIFLPFYTTKPIGSGTGMGLSISHGIIEQHGGKITVTSTLGKGSCFTVTIPMAKQP